MLRRREEPNGPPVPKLDRETLVRVRHATRLLVGIESRFWERGDEASAILAPLDPDVVLNYWAYEGVVALAAGRASLLGLEPREWATAALDHRTEAAERRIVQEMVTHQATRSLARAGVRSAVLKGPLMAAQIHGDPSLRGPSTDVDLLVDKVNLWQATEVITSLGWEQPSDPLDEDQLPHFHLALPGPRGLPGIELHWRVHWYEELFGPQILERAEASGRLDSLDTLRVLLLCWARDGFHRLRLAADIAAWADRFGPIDDGAVMADAPASLLRPLSAALTVASSVIGQDVRAAHRHQRAVLRICGTDSPVTPRQIFSQIALIDLLIAPPKQKKKRFSTMWLRELSTLQSRYPEATSAQLRVLRLLSLGRTIKDSTFLLARASFRGSNNAT